MRRAATVALVALGLVVGVGVPPAVADDSVQLSTDGTHWSNALVADLFAPHLAWVPGDVDTATLYVRTTCSSGTGQADVALGSGGGALVGVLDVRTRTDGGAWAGPSSAFTVVGGQVTRLDVEVTYDPAATSTTQLSSVPLTVTVVVSCDDAATGPTRTVVAHPPAQAAPVLATPTSGLARTGTTVLAVVVVALLLGLAGAGLASLRPVLAPSGGPRRPGRTSPLPPRSGEPRA